MPMVADSLLHRLEWQARRYVDWRERARLGKRHGTCLPDAASTAHLRVGAGLKVVCPHFDVLIDVGAHVGRFAQAMCCYWDFDEVICVEPNTTLHEQISAAVGQKAKIYGYALGERSGQTTYYRHPNSSMNSLHSVEPEAFDRKFRFHTADEVTTSTVEARSLEWIIEKIQFAASRDILLKLDTQGSELEILRSGGKQLSRASACVIEHMFWGGYRDTPEFDEIVLYMRDVGFRCRGVLDLQFRKSGEAACADFLFQRVDA